MDKMNDLLRHLQLRDRLRKASRGRIAPTLERALPDVECDVLMKYRAGLTQKEVEIHGAKGTYRAKRWVRTGETPATGDKPKAGDTGRVGEITKKLADAGVKARGGKTWKEINASPEEMEAYRGRMKAEVGKLGIGKVTIAERRGIINALKEGGHFTAIRALFLKPKKATGEAKPEGAKPEGAKAEARPEEPRKEEPEKREPENAKEIKKLASKVTWFDKDADDIKDLKTGRGVHLSGYSVEKEKAESKFGKKVTAFSPKGNWIEYAPESDETFELAKLIGYRSYSWREPHEESVEIGGKTYYATKDAIFILE